MTRIWMLVAAGLALAVGAMPALAQKKQLAIVVEGRDNPLYASISDGCDQWNADNKASPYECLFTGPASSLDKIGELQIVDDLITTGAAGIAIVPADPATMADLIRQKQPLMPIVTIDTDLAAADRALRKTYIGIDEYTTGVTLAGLLRERKPAGGTVCLQVSKSDAEAVNARAAGFRDTISGVKGTAKLIGQNNWQEASNCPLEAGDDAAAADKQIAAVIASNPYLDALVLMAGRGPDASQAFAKAVAPAAAKLKAGTLVIISVGSPPQADALKAGRLQAQVGPPSSAIGRTVPDLMLTLISGRTVPDPFFVAPEVCTPATLASCAKK